MPIQYGNQQGNNSGLLWQIISAIASSGGGEGGNKLSETSQAQNLTGRGEGEMGGLAETGRDVSEYGTISENLPSVQRNNVQYPQQPEKSKLGLLMSIIAKIYGGGA